MMMACSGGQAWIGTDCFARSPRAIEQNTFDSFGLTHSTLKSEIASAR